MRRKAEPFEHGTMFCFGDRRIVLDVPDLDVAVRITRYQKLIFLPIAAHGRHAGTRIVPSIELCEQSALGVVLPEPDPAKATGRDEVADAATHQTRLQEQQLLDSLLCGRRAHVGIQHLQGRDAARLLSAEPARTRPRPEEAPLAVQGFEMQTGIAAMTRRTAER